MNQTGNKGLHPLAWVAIGCGALILIGVVAITAGGLFVAKKVGDVAKDFEDNPVRVAAETVVRLNPDLDLVESDPEAGTMTVRNNKTGEESTLNFEDIAEGRFSYTDSEGEEVSIDASGAAQGEAVTITSEEGEVRFGGGSDEDLPDWLLLYPGASTPQSAYHASSGTEHNGLASSETDDEVEEVVEYYEETFEDEGYTVQTVRMNAGGTTQAIVTAERQDPKRTQVVNVLREEAGKTKIGYQYSGEND